VQIGWPEDLIIRSGFENRQDRRPRLVLACRACATGSWVGL